ncbi:hypothetical protein [Cellulomonas sp.]|uniref:hypothetical protein n=1 Tax=Cellulomonas sp. TaxID=40001 RepID=UPI0025864285|nr:hypothetical protein [Cellulomonas sp.]MCR6690435.1 hypothetical protein [Cellulomonas sp.]
MGVTTGLATVGTGRKRLTALLAGVALVASAAVAAPAGAADAQPAAVTASITIASAVSKSATGCKDIVYKVNLSGLDPNEYYSLTSKIAYGSATVNGYAASTLVNGANRVEAFVCSSTLKAGAYRVFATIKSGGTTVATAAPKSFNLKVKPVWTSLGGSGVIGGAGTIRGSLSPSLDVSGKVVKVYFKKAGASTYKALGSTRVNSSGSFTWKWSKATVGSMYVKLFGNTYVSTVKSPTMAIKRTS